VKIDLTNPERNQATPTDMYKKAYLNQANLRSASVAVADRVHISPEAHALATANSKTEGSGNEDRYNVWDKFAAFLNEKGYDVDAKILPDANEMPKILNEFGNLIGKPGLGDSCLSCGACQNNGLDSCPVDMTGQMLN